jgi:glycerophosphoryl diester phosphodiesterase
MLSGTRRVAVALAALAVLGAGAETASARAFDLEGHRGARGLRPENTLAAFGKALQVGVTTLELDTGVTKDGVVVVSHERRISPLECQGPYVGKLIHELTYAQIQKLDCGTRHPADPSTDPFVGTQEAVPGTHMPSLAQVFQLVNRYGADKVQFDIETKRDPTVPKETVGPTTFAKKVIAVISRYHMTRRSVLQSFDWSTLQAARKIKPRLRRAALADNTTIVPGSPWTGGIEIGAARLRGRPRARGGRRAARPDPLGQLPRHHRQAHQGRPPARPDDHPVDRRRPRPHGAGHRPRPGRAHHRLPRQGPRRDGRQGPRPARAVRVALRHRGPSRRARLPAREHAERLCLRPRPRGRHARDGHRRDQGRRAGDVPQPPDQRRALPRHGARDPGRPALPLRGQEHQGPHAGPDQDARLRLHRSGLPEAGPPARREDADPPGGLRPRGRARGHPRALQHRDEDQPAGRGHRPL